MENVGGLFGIYPYFNLLSYKHLRMFNHQRYRMDEQMNKSRSKIGAKVLHKSFPNINKNDEFKKPCYQIADFFYFYRCLI
jgi:hypothetical protein